MIRCIIHQQSWSWRLNPPVDNAVCPFRNAIQFLEAVTDIPGFVQHVDWWPSPLKVGLAEVIFPLIVLPHLQVEGQLLLLRIPGCHFCILAIGLHQLWHLRRCTRVLMNEDLKDNCLASHCTCSRSSLRFVPENKLWDMKKDFHNSYIEAQQKENSTTALSWALPPVLIDAK